jgi:hypothetical protein
MNGYKTAKEFLSLPPTKMLIAFFIVVTFALCGVIKNLVGRLDGQRKEYIQNELDLRKSLDICNNRNATNIIRFNRKKDSIYNVFQGKIENLNKDVLRLHQMNKQ